MHDYKCINILNFIKWDMYNILSGYIKNQRKSNYLILANFIIFKNIILLLFNIFNFYFRKEIYCFLFALQSIKTSVAGWCPQATS